jgi:hypothetical protein
VNDRQLTSAHACDREDSGKPDAGNPHVRFDEGGGGQDTGPSATLPLQLCRVNTICCACPFSFFSFHTGRFVRQRKAAISAELAGIFERLGSSAQSWQNRMEKLRDGRLLGRFFATTRAKPREIAERLGMRRPVNVASYPVR